MDLQKMSIEELLNLRAKIADIVEAKVQAKASQLRPGAQVRVNHPKTVGKLFTVIKINRETVKMKDDRGVIYRVHKSFVVS